MKDEKVIKVYLAILNSGWIRAEMAASVIPKMENTAGVELFWERPSVTWAEPICSNRAHITKRFLKSECDFLLMIDADIVPLHNPVELVFADKDIIGSPAKVRQDNQSLNWAAYAKAKDQNGDEGYYPVDFGRVSSDIDLLKVDIVGTGCILIKRHVLENIKAPFLVEFNEDGTNHYGTDFAFCRRAAIAGYDVYTTPQRICEHIKEFGLLAIDGYDESDYRDISPSPYAIPWGGMSINQRDWEFIKDVIESHEIKCVLEFGAGLSSLLMSEIVAVDSYDTDPTRANAVSAKTLPASSLIVYEWNGGIIAPNRNWYDMAFVDGPLGKDCNGGGRQHSIHIASKSTDIVIVHDAGRIDEHRWQNKYLRPDFKMVAKSGNHQSRCQLWIRKENDGNKVEH